MALCVSPAPLASLRLRCCLSPPVRRGVARSRNHNKAHHSRPVVDAAAAISISTPQTATGNDAAWRDFSKNASGEWDGYGAEFSPLGAPYELPSAVVPEAFREWEVQLFDWQTQCPTLVNDSLQYRLIRLLPTVGCEADAATQYSVDERNASNTDSGVDLLAFHTSGSYIALWPGSRVLKQNFGAGQTSKFYVTESDKKNTLEVEHCLVHNGDPRTRIRILQEIEMQESPDGSRNSPILKKITLQREKWESEFRNGEVLGGCSTSGSAFANTPKLQVAELKGAWECKTFAAESELLDGFQQLIYVGLETVKRDPLSSLLALPKGLWSMMMPTEEGHFSVGAGWLVGSGSAITSTCVLSRNGKARKIQMRFEQRKD